MEILDLDGTGARQFDYVVASARGGVTYRFARPGEKGHGRTARTPRIVESVSSGGLPSALSGALGPDGLWLAFAQTDADRLVAEQVDGPFTVDMLGRKIKAQLVVPPPYAPFVERLAGVHLGQTTLLDRERFDVRQVEDDYRSWMEANRRMVAAVVHALHSRREHEAASRRPDAPARPQIVGLNDHQLYPMGGLLRSEVPDALMFHFVHMPMAERQAWEALPWWMVTEIVASTLSCDLVGFHTWDWADAYLGVCDSLEGVSVDRASRVVRGPDGRTTKVGAFPLPADAEALTRLADLPATRRWKGKISSGVDRHGGVHLDDLFSFYSEDRSDPVKNLHRMIEAYALMLREHPEARERVVYLAHVMPSRQDVAVQSVDLLTGDEVTTYPYRRYLREVIFAVAGVNHEFGTGKWLPIELFEQEDRELGAALKTVCCAVVAAAVREGNNLVAKETVLLNPEALVILSRRAGAAAELRSAILVDPSDVRSLAAAMWRAYSMPEAERAVIARAVHDEALANGTPAQWMEDQLRTLWDHTRSRSTP